MIKQVGLLYTCETSGQNDDDDDDDDDDFDGEESLNSSW